MEKQGNLFDKYGGVPTIKLILKAFYREVLKKSYFKKFFVNVNMEKLILHQVEFISFAMGKPLTDYPDDFLRKGHAGLNITDIQFDEIVNILEKILINFQVENKDITSIKDAIDRKRHLIVMVDKLEKTEEQKINKDMELYLKMKLVKIRIKKILMIFIIAVNQIGSSDLYKFLKFSYISLEHR